MPDRGLHGCRILVVEDEYILAAELEMELSDEGAIIVGPAGTLADAMKLIREDTGIHGAVLDVNLRGEWVYPAADLLAAIDVPFVFTTGYDASVIPPRFTRVPRCEKPVSIREVARSIGTALAIL